MKLITSLSEVPQRGSGNFVAIGSWDGVHLGHQALIARLVVAAREQGGQAVVMGFEPHPLAVVRPELAPKLLTLLPERAAILAELGVDCHLVLPFNREFASLSPEAFVEQILVRGLQARQVLVGFNWTFGQGGRGTPADLARLGAAQGLEVLIQEPIAKGQEVISSSAIRAHLEAGQVEAAQALLGRPFQLRGVVVQGDQRGRTLGFPTANLAYAPERQLPGVGVYAVLVTLPDQRQVQGVANLGYRPTFAGEGLRLEVHLLDFAGDLYGQELAVAFVGRLRGERTFASAEALAHQLQADVQAARERLGPLAVSPRV